MKKSAIIVVFFVLIALILGVLFFSRIIDVDEIINPVNQLVNPQQNVIAGFVSISGLTPTVAKVGDKVSLIGTVTYPNGNYTVWFDINNNGYPFDPEELLTTGKANDKGNISLDFKIPSCSGSDQGVNHSLVLRDEDRTIGSYLVNYGYTATRNLTIVTSRNIAAPSSIQSGESMPIQLTVTGGLNNTAYGYNIRITKPDGATSTKNITLNSNPKGDVSTTIIYPNDFQGQTANQNGNYAIFVSETAPNNTKTLSSIVQVQDGNGSKFPVANIISIQPNPATNKQQVTFNGTGSTDGEIVAYKWTSSISGIISNSSIFTISNLPVGNHEISFEVQDNKGLWSQSAKATLQIQTTPEDGDTNHAPTAQLDTTPPDKIEEGQSVTIAGHGTDIDGTIVTYTWTSNISGIVSNSNELDASKLTQGIHKIDFQVADNNNSISNIVTFNLIVNPPSTPSSLLPIAVGVVAISGAAASGGAAVWLHSKPTSAKVKAKVEQKRSEQAKREQVEEEKEDEKNKRRKLKRQPYLVIESADVPSNIMKDSAYKAKITLQNKGIGDATKVNIKAIGNPFVEFREPIALIPKLEPGAKGEAVFDFKTSQDVRKNVYHLQFQTACPKAPTKTKKCIIRGGRIALLSDPKKPENAEPVRAWLQKNNYPYQDIDNAAHLLRELSEFDLIIVPSGQEMPSTWVKNLCKFVKNSQSLLLIDRITTSNPEPLMQTLDYNQAGYQTLDYAEAELEICAEHPVTKGFNIGDKIPLGLCTANACIFTQTTANILAKKMGGLKENPFPAITAKESGQGKIVHLNFHAEEHLDQLNQLTINAINWLLWG